MFGEQRGDARRQGTKIPPRSSSRRKPGSIGPHRVARRWIPAFAAMTEGARLSRPGRPGSLRLWSAMSRQGAPGRHQSACQLVGACLPLCTGLREGAPMAEKSFVALGERGLLVVAGEDRRVFLQGLISNDVEKVAASRAIHAALLTAQGKYLHDFFVAALGETLILDGEAARLGDLQRRLGLYRLRTKVTLAPAAGDLGVFAAFGGEAPAALGPPDPPGAAAPFGGGGALFRPRPLVAAVPAAMPARPS